MKRLISPYVGDEKYAFVSFCHKDEKRVYPVICGLMNGGCRVWYDAAIAPGLEWPEVIAEHLSACTACVAFVSEASLMSHNCRKEINFALMKNKPLLIVMLDEVKLSPGMEMQLSTVQSVLAYRSGTDVLSALREFGALSDCFGEPNGSETVPFPEMLSEKQKEPLNARKETDPAKTGANIISKDISVMDNSDTAAAETRLYLERASDNGRILPKGALTVGRSAECGYPLIGISKVSSRHAELTAEDQKLYVRDLGSTNGTFVNGRKIAPNQKHELVCGDEVCLASEKFIVRSGCFKRCERIVVEEIRNGRTTAFPADKPIIIGSDPEKCSLTLSGSKFVSREHLLVEAKGKELYVADLDSINGSYIQGVRLKAGEKRPLYFAVTAADEPLYIAFEPDKTEE